ncbi:MAG: ABC transporter permease [Oscillospiraceae bacterium]|jgi:NitT/TauT family transport system permease protein|nr:ABC transporter permease [Oscillospiraceae bacterium]
MNANNNENGAAYASVAVRAGNGRLSGARARLGGFWAHLPQKILSLRRLLGIAVFFALWELLPRAGFVNKNFLTPFTTVVATFANLLRSGVLIKHIGVSLQRSAIGLSLGFAISIPLGILIASFKRLEYYLDPLIQTLRQTSIIALLPVFLLLFGIKESAKYAIVCWGVWAPLLLNTINGVKGVDPILIKAARAMGATRLIVYTRVIFPSAFPSVVTGLRLAATSSLLVLTAAEMMGASSGLGYLIHYSQSLYQVPNMYAAILTMSLLGILTNYLLVQLEKRVTRWKPKT